MFYKGGFKLGIKAMINEFVDLYVKDENRKIDSSKAYHRLLTKDIRTEIDKSVENKYKIKGSVGTGYKTRYPWVGIFHPDITTSAQTGIYVVLLFKSDLKGFYLSLGQGITNFKNRYQKDAYKNIEMVAQYFRNNINSSNFNIASINLLTKKGDLGYGYEKGNIVSKYYDIDDFSEPTFFNDLDELLKIYDDIYETMYPESYETIVDSLISSEDLDLVLTKEADDLIEKTLLKTTEEDTLNIKTLKQVQVPKGKQKSFVQIENKAIKKTDYIEKSIRDTHRGFLGEKLVIEFEKDRLKSIGLEEYIPKIKWVSKESDAYGYDVLSYDLVNQKIINRMIEVKSSNKSANAAFYVSKNEVEISKKHQDNYWIYRIYDIESKDPKVYCIQGSFEKNFILEPSIYIANLKIRK